MLKKACSIILSAIVSMAGFNANASLILEVSQEIVSGGITSTIVTDQNYLSANLTNGYGSASLASLRSFNQDTDTGGSSYFNRSGWTLTDLVFSADTPGASTATVGIGGQLTAALDAQVDFGGFTGASAAVRVRYGLSYNTVTGSVNTGGMLFEEVIGVGGFGGVLQDSRNVNEYVGTVLSIPVDTPVTLSFSLETVAGLDVAPGVAISDAANSLVFDTNQFFDIQTSGVTANAGNFLVNNSVPSPVPVPAAAWLFASGLLGLVGLARRRQMD